jgi:MSHA biogenesis protein MshM
MSALYLNHFNLSIDPFRITPDTEFFFSGGQRGDILEGLIVASMHDEGIVSVVSEIGMGKTMLSRMLLERLRLLPSDTVYLSNPVFDKGEILGAIARDLLPEPPQGSHAHMLAALELVLIERYSQGRRVVVVIDEAHSMPPSTLEEIRLLSNLETTQHKLIKIVLFGQPELDVLLDTPQLRQVKDRISHRFELQPFSAAEASAYLMFRLHKAGWKGGELFDAGALKLLAQASQGRTRKLSMLADKSMLAAYAQGMQQVGARQVRRASSDSLPRTKRPTTTTKDKAARVTSVWQKSLPMSLGLLVALGAGYGVGTFGANEQLKQVISFSWGAVLSQVKEPLNVVSRTLSPLADLVKGQPQAASSAADLSATPLSVQSVQGDGSTTPSPLAADAAAEPVPTLATQLRATSLAVRKRATDDFIALPSSQGFTVQLLSLRASREAEMLALAQKVQTDLDETATPSDSPASDVPVLVHNRFYQRQIYQVMYAGHFESRPAAMQFIKSSPLVLGPYKPIIRSLESIRKEGIP